MARKSPIVPHYNMDFEIFDWQEMHNQANRRYLQDVETRRNDLEDQLHGSEIRRNNAETALIRKQLEILERQEEEARREAYERWIRSPEGQAAIKKYNDRQYFVREKSINFLFRRPYNLLVRKNLESVTYKNYISIIYWIFFLVPAVYNYGIFGLFLGVLMSVLLILFFYFVYFEIKYFFHT